ARTGQVGRAAMGSVEYSRALGRAGLRGQLSGVGFRQHSGWARVGSAPSGARASTQRRSGHRTADRFPRQRRCERIDRDYFGRRRRQLDGALSTSATLSGRTAIITGAGAGIGRGLALALAAAGCRVIVAVRRRSTGDETEGLIAA